MRETEAMPVPRKTQAEAAAMLRQVLDVVVPEEGQAERPSDVAIRRRIEGAVSALEISTGSEPT
jgi:hypothetical protein